MVEVTQEDREAAKQRNIYVIHSIAPQPYAYSRTPSPATASQQSNAASWKAHGWRLRRLRARR